MLPRPTARISIPLRSSRWYRRRRRASSPLPEQLAKGLVVVRYRTEHLRIVPVFGTAALDVSPRVGHLHVTLDGAPWHWVDASGEPLIVKGLSAGPHALLIELADPTHRVVDRTTVHFDIPQRPIPEHPTRSKRN